MPLHYDETWTYYNFTSRGIKVSATFYPLPNNHILFSVLTAVMEHFPGDPKIKMRLISVCSAVLLNVLFVRFASRYYKEQVIILPAVLLAFSHPMLNYAVQARGYALLTLMVWLMFMAIVALLEKRQIFRNSLLYIISVCGVLYTIPSGVYAIFAANVALYLLLIFRREKALIVRFTICNLLAGMGTYLLYRPVLKLNGTDAFSHVVHLSKAELLPKVNTHLISVAKWMVGMPWGMSFLLVVILAVAVLGATEKRAMNRTFDWFVVVFLLSPFFILLLHRVIPFERTWIYLVPFVSLGLMAILDRALIKITSANGFVLTTIIALSVCCIFLLNNAFFKAFRAEHDCDFAIANAFANIPHTPDAHKIGVLDWGQDPYSYYTGERLQYELLHKDKIRTDVTVLNKEQLATFDWLIIKDKKAQDSLTFGNFTTIDSNRYFELLKRN
ncbi:hypothetical protein DN068_06610 [Taibaiella soli]|uniref:Glycosyltransferase RgtA/B/C/D-like domain-containing protein n=1 Tax=Taibaiella soli TaxID=1649169 RepID=A0A2W2B082_9BACT|nr:hypothetical protein DN068_06610 [Taibaiella soli]